MKFKEAFKNAIECNIQSIEAGSTKQADTDTHHCGCNERRVRRPSKAVFTVAHGCCKVQCQIRRTDIAKMISYAANTVQMGSGLLRQMAVLTKSRCTVTCIMWHANTSTVAIVCNYCTEYSMTPWVIAVLHLSKLVLGHYFHRPKSGWVWLEARGGGGGIGVPI